MNLSTIETNLAAVFVATTGIKAKWVRRPHDWVGPSSGQTPQAYGLLHIRSPRGQGKDSLEWEEDAGAAVGSELTPHARGNREFIWEVQVRTFSGNAGENAAHYLELLRDSLRLPSVEALFEAAEIGVQSVPASRDHTVTLPGRMESAATLEITFNAESDLEGTAIGYVETFGMEGTALDQDGNETTIIDGLAPAS